MYYSLVSMNDIRFHEKMKTIKFKYRERYITRFRKIDAKYRYDICYKKIGNLRSILRAMLP